MFCFIIKLLIEKQYDDFGKVRSGYLLKHISNCKSCASWVHVVSGVSAKLHSEDSSAMAEIESRIKENTLRKLRESSVKSGIYYANWSAIRRAATFAVAASLMFAVGLFVFNTSPEPVDYVQVGQEEDITEVVSVVVPESMNISLPVFGDYLDSYYESELEQMRLQISDTIRFLGDCIPMELAEL